MVLGKKAYLVFAGDLSTSLLLVTCVRLLATVVPSLLTLAAAAKVWRSTRRLDASMVK